MDVKILDDGQVMIDDHLIGQLDGLKFTLAESGSELETKALKSAAEAVVAPEVDKRLTSLCGGTHAIFTLSEDGAIMWGGKSVGRIGKGGTVFTPDAELIGGDLGQDNLQNMAVMRMRDFLRAEVEAKLAPLKAIKDLSENADMPAEVKGFAFEVFENYGVLERKQHSAKINALTQDMRSHLRQANIVFGQYHIYLRDLMKPKPAALLSLLTSYGAGGDKAPFIPFAGMTSLKNEGDLHSDKFTPEAIRIAGYKALGPRIIRLDILDRLSRLIRQAQERGPRNSFQIMQEMLSLLGSTLDEVRGVLTAMGFKSQDGEADPKELEKISKLRAAKEEAIKATNPDVTSSATSEDTASHELVPGKGEDPENAEKTESTPEDQTPKAETPTPAPKPKARGRKDLNVHHERITQEDGTTVDKPNVEYWFMPSRRGKNIQKPGQTSNRYKGQAQKGQAHGGKSRNNNRNNDKPKSSKRSQAAPKRRLEDSPFAALAALKNPPKDS